MELTNGQVVFYSGTDQLLRFSEVAASCLIITVLHLQDNLSFRQLTSQRHDGYSEVCLP